MANINDDMSVAVQNIQAFEDAVGRFCDYQSKMNQAYLDIIDSIRILMHHGTEEDCDTISEYVTAFTSKFPASVGTYAIQLLEQASAKYDEFYTSFKNGSGKFQHATIRGLINAARIYKELEKDMFYDRGVKFECASDPAFVAASNLDMY